MAKQGMKRPDYTHTHPKNDVAPVPELQGKAKHTKQRANHIIAGTKPPAQKAWHTERPIPEDIYPAIDTDLARDNVENHLTAADVQDL